MGPIITRTVCPCCGKNSITKALTCTDHTVSGESFEIWACSTCTLRFTQYVPDQQSIGPYYQSNAYISHTDSEKGLINKLYKVARNYTLSWKLKLVNEWHKEKMTGKLLDIGAGTGAFLNHAHNKGWEVQGLEPDEGARKIAANKYQLELRDSTALFNLPTGSMDIITMWHVLEHVHQLHEYIREIRRVLKPGGTALIALPNYTSYDATYYSANWAAYDVPRHLYHFSPAAFKTLVGKHSMQVQAVKPMWLDAYYIAMLSEKYRNGTGNLPRAVINGWKSNWKARKKQRIETCSSLVYVVRNIPVQ